LYYQISDIVRDFDYNKSVALSLNIEEHTMEKKYLSLKETAKKWGISDRRINTLCLNGRIPGAFKVGNSWAIPEDATKPDDGRIKSGLYIKNKNK
jgi:hypothetical protein